jgi:hypothetical protein
MDKNKSVKELVAQNISLLEQAQNSKSFIELFSRNFSKRINEHLSLLNEILDNVKVISEQSEKKYNKLNEDIDDSVLKYLVQLQLKEEIKRRDNIKLAKEHVDYVNELMSFVTSLDILSLNERNLFEKVKMLGGGLWRSVVPHLNESTLKKSYDFFNNEYKKNVNELTSIVVKRLAKKINETVTGISDLGNTAAESIKTLSENEVVSWWSNALTQKKNEYVSPKNKLIMLQQVLTTTSNKINELKNDIKKARL